MISRKLSAKVMSTSSHGNELIKDMEVIVNNLTLFQKNMHLTAFSIFIIGKYMNHIISSLIFSFDFPVLLVLAICLIKNP